MSRIEVSSYQPIKTFQYFTPSYKEIIREKDKKINQFMKKTMALI